MDIKKQMALFPVQQTFPKRDKRAELAPSRFLPLHLPVGEVDIEELCERICPSYSGNLNSHGYKEPTLMWGPRIVASAP